MEKIHSSFEKIQKKNKVTVIEGTGHTGVGSIVDLNNAQVAALLKCPIILVASGGLGSSFDELALNYAQCQSYNVPVAGVILNRVIDEKKEMILDYIPKALKRWDIPLLGSIPFTSLLSMPTMADFEILFQTPRHTGKKQKLRHFQNIRLVASSVEIFRTAIAPNELIVTPAGREDIILAILTRFWDLKISHPEEDLQTAIILTGKTPPKENLIEQIQKANIPMIYVPLSSFTAMKMINSFISKIRFDDTKKIEKAISVVENHVDFEKLEKAVACSSS